MAEVIKLENMKKSSRHDTEEWWSVKCQKKMGSSMSLRGNNNKPALRRPQWTCTGRPQIGGQLICVSSAVFCDETWNSKEGKAVCDAFNEVALYVLVKVQEEAD